MKKILGNAALLLFTVSAYGLNITFQNQSSNTCLVDISGVGSGPVARVFSGATFSYPGDVAPSISRDEGVSWSGFDWTSFSSLSGDNCTLVEFDIGEGLYQKHTVWFFLKMGFGSGLGIAAFAWGIGIVKGVRET
jgi:hypothetical protein